MLGTRRTVALAILLASWSCRERSAQQTTIHRDSVPPVAPPVIAPRPVTIPDQFQGKWAGTQAQCGRPSESSLSIEADRIDSYEARGRVLEVKLISDLEVELTIEWSGEGQVSRSARRFMLTEDKRSLTDVTTEYRTARVRCES